MAGYLGNIPTAVPLTSADITDGIIVNADIANSTINLTTKVTGTLPVANGGTGLTALGTSLQVLRMNSGATALEFATASSGAMVFLAETSASNVASVSLNGYFTSAYDVYKIFIDGNYGSTQTYTSMTFNTTGSYTEQTSDYYAVMGDFIDSGSTVGNVWNGIYSDSKMTFQYNSTTEAQAGVSELTIYNPMSTTYHKFVTGDSSGYYGSHAGWSSFSGAWKNATAITGINFKRNTGNLYARKIRLYGIKNS
jgi:hypothetical protein